MDVGSGGHESSVSQSKREWRSTLVMVDEVRRQIIAPRSDR